MIEFVKFPYQGKGWDEKGFGIATAIHDETGERITIKGPFGPVNAGDRIEIFDRRWVDDSRFGEQLQVWRAQRDTSTREGIISYLQTLPGVGPVLAEAICDGLGGPGCLDKIDADPEILLTVRTPAGRGIPSAALPELAQAWEEVAGDRAASVYLHSLDIGNATARKIIAKFGLRSEEMIKENPYCLTHVDGVRFLMADRIARKLGIGTTDPRRIAAGVEFCIEDAEGDGHICLTREQIFARAPHLLAKDGAGPSERQLDAAIDTMVAAGRLHKEVDFDDGTERIYTTENFMIETRLYDGLRNVLMAPKRLMPRDLAKPEGSPLTDEQWHATESAFTERLSVLTGGPGTGKTTSLRAMIDACEQRGQHVVCLAPTGKAAKRMEESTGRDASTIHRLLGFEGRKPPTSMEAGPVVNDGRGIAADVVIVDESSMLDMKLAERLISNLGSKTRMVLVGDPDQLPAVGAGSVLLDLIESGRVPITRLTKVHRQAEGSLITLNAHRIRQGQDPYWTREEAEEAVGHPVNDDFHFVEANEPQQVMASALKLHAAALGRLGLTENDVMIASPQRKGNAGVWVLNKALQAKLNPQGAQIREGDEPLRVGDRVMNTVNRYAPPKSEDPDIMNGDVGRILSFDPDTKTVVAEFDGYEGTPIKFNGREQIDGLKPAYASTVHKLQGSEAPMIIMPVAGNKTGGATRMVNRNLIYTGLTRGQEKSILIGSKQAIREALSRDGSKRNTTLDLRVGRIEERLRLRMERLAELPSDEAAREILFGRQGVDPASSARSPSWSDPDHHPDWAHRQVTVAPVA